MDLMKVLLENSGGANVAQLARQFGLDAETTQKIAAQVVPALGRGLQKNAAAPGGLDSLLQGLQQGNHKRYLDDPAALQDPAALTDGKAILGHILGSKDVSRNVAAHAAAQTGVDANMIKQMLPMLAALAMGALSKQTNGGKQLRGGGSDLLGSLLDSNHDGQVMDDVLNIARKFF